MLNRSVDQGHSLEVFALVRMKNVFTKPIAVILWSQIVFAFHQVLWVSRAIQILRFEAGTRPRLHKVALKTGLDRNPTEF